MGHVLCRLSTIEIEDYFHANLGATRMRSIHLRGAFHDRVGAEHAALTYAG